MDYENEVVKNTRNAALFAVSVELQSSNAVCSRHPCEGDVFPDLKLPLPQKMAEREYLKIDQGPFHLSQIDSAVLIVEIFSIYCPFCQKEAPNVNSLFRTILANP